MKRIYFLVFAFLVSFSLYAAQPDSDPCWRCGEAGKGPGYCKDCVKILEGNPKSTSAMNLNTTLILLTIPAHTIKHSQQYCH